MVTPGILRPIYEQLEKMCRNAGIIAGKSGRHMKYPYTFTAKVAQFPLFFYLKNNWIWMYYPVAATVSFYLFSKINAMANSEGNIRSWNETCRRNAEKEAHAHDH